MHPTAIDFFVSLALAFAAPIIIAILWSITHG